MLEDYAFRQELVENVKKMWGSASVLVWYLMNQNLEHYMTQKRVFILETPYIENRMYRPLRNMISALDQYRNGAYDEIKFSVSRNNPKSRF